MRQYELTYLISDSVPENDLNKVTGKVGGLIAEADGQILKEEIWKRRKLAYPINKQTFATYVTLNLELSRQKTSEFEKQIRLTPQIIRHLLIVKDQGDKAYTLTTDEIVDTEAIEKAIGGEKSFEVVEGETQASRDLMAVREAAEEERQPHSVTAAGETTRGEEDKEKEDQPHSAKATRGEEGKNVKGRKEKADTEEKPVAEKPKRIRKKPAAESEADRLAKLDEELDNLLKDDL